MSKNICITGASRGIGLGLTLQYLQAGQNVWAVARHPAESSALQAAARDYRNSLHIVQADISREADLQGIADSINHQALDILINNAGQMLDNPTAPFTDMSLDTFRQTFEVNVWGPIALSQKLIPALKRSTAPILAMMSSQMGSLSSNHAGGYYAYRTSKVALNMITRNLAQEYPWLLSVSLHPGWVQTDMGGAQAPTSIDDSVTGLNKVLSQLKREQSGSFLDFHGKKLDW